MSKRPLQASIAPDFLFKGRIDVHDTKSFLLAFIAPDFSENVLNKLETFSMRARHITGLAHNALLRPSCMSLFHHFSLYPSNVANQSLIYALR